MLNVTVSLILPNSWLFTKSVWMPMAPFVGMSLVLDTFGGDGDRVFLDVTRVWFMEGEEPPEHIEVSALLQRDMDGPEIELALWEDPAWKSENEDYLMAHPEEFEKILIDCRKTLYTSKP